jgi:hydroxypyruvate isomerase
MTTAVKPTLDRRQLLVASLLAPLGISAGQRGAPGAAIVPSTAPIGPPPYKLSINIELMFRAANLSRADRIRAIAAKGFTGYSFWSANADERAAMLKAQNETGLTCVSIVGTGPSGGTTGFTRPGAAETLLSEIKERVEIAKQFGAPDLICFVGLYQTDVPWDVQRAGIVEGLKRAGDIARAGGVTITFEPLSDLPRRALDRTAEAFPVIAEVNHPNVKLCFDIYHLQRTEGNIVVNLRKGLADKLIKVVQIGDVPGRLEPGTGEINYPFIFKELRRLGYSGWLDTEMGTSSTADHAMDVARKLSLEN